MWGSDARRPAGAGLMGTEFVEPEILVLSRPVDSCEPTLLSRPPLEMDALLMNGISEGPWQWLTTVSWPLPEPDGEGEQGGQTQSEPEDPLYIEMDLQQQLGAAIALRLEQTAREEARQQRQAEMNANEQRAKLAAAEAKAKLLFMPKTRAKVLDHPPLRDRSPPADASSKMMMLLNK